MRHGDALAVVGEGHVGVAKRLRPFRHRLDGRGAVGPVGVHVKIAANVRRGHEARQLARRGERDFTAVLAFDDLTALGVVRGLSEEGIRVPQDCSVMGFDDVLPAEVATPAMTTIRQPLREMGLEAAGSVLRAIKSGAGSQAKIKLHLAQPELVARKSTAAVKQVSK